MNQVKLNQFAGVSLGKAPQKLASPAKMAGRFNVEHIRDGEVIGTHDFPNGISDQGKDLLLDVMFHNTSAAAAWYIGLIDNAGYSALAADDTYDDIDQAGNGWDEFTAYTDGNNSDNATTRPVWPEDAAASQSITNSSVAIFNITGTGTVKGVMVVGLGAAAMTKSDHDTDGNLWATALFGSGDVAVQSGDQLKVTYTVNA